ncbi:hypothetical protein ACWDSJ_13100 [Nocardia sp. NPDC003482]
MSSIGEYFASALIRGIDEGVGTPGLVQSMHATPRDGSLELMTGTPGPQGPAGEPCVSFRWEGDIADQAALSAMATKLGPAQAGKAWRVLATDTLVYWNGSSFDTFVEAFGAAGPEGNPCTITLGSVDTGPAGSEFQATVTGTAPNLVLNLTVPRGVRGRKGEVGGPGPIRGASDFADTATLADRSVPTWDTSVQKWRPRPYPGLRGPWSLMEGQAWDGGVGFAASQNNVSAASITVAQLNIPAQDCDWRPMVTGGVVVQNLEGTSTFNTRVDAEVRLGSASGQIVALGTGLGASIDAHCRFQEYYGARVTPSSTAGVVSAGQPAVLVVVIRRNAGSANYNYSRAGAQIVCWARPVGLPLAP